MEVIISTRAGAKTIRKADGKWDRIQTAAAAASMFDLNYTALRLGDPHGDGRPAMGEGPANISTSRVGALLEDYNAGDIIKEVAVHRLDALIIDVDTILPYGFDHYLRSETVTAKPKKSSPATPTPPAPEPAPVVVSPGDSNEEEETMTNWQEVALQHLETSRILAAEIASLKGPAAAHPLEGIRISPTELAEDLDGYQPPKELIQMVARISATEGANPRRIRRLFDFAGPAGGGKSLGAKFVAQALGWSLVKIDCGLIEDSGKGFLLEQGTSNGTLTEELSRFSKAISTPQTVVLLDEIARAPMSAQNGLLPIFDSGMAAEFSYTTGASERVVRHPQTVSIMARNEGREYVGCGSIDAALLNRAERVQILPPSPAAVRKLLAASGVSEQTLDRLLAVYTIVTSMKVNGKCAGLPASITNLASEVARIPAESVSLRGLSATAMAIAAGVDEEEAFTVGLYRHMAIESRKGDPVAEIARAIGHNLRGSGWSRSQVVIGLKGISNA